MNPSEFPKIDLPVSFIITNEVTPEKAMEIAQELCHRLLKEQYQYVIAIHTDHQHCHAHIIVNNTNFITGKTFETEHNQGKKKRTCVGRAQTHIGRALHGE